MFTVTRLSRSGLLAGEGDLGNSFAADVPVTCTNQLTEYDKTNKMICAPSKD